jgi:hypothetical protein
MSGVEFVLITARLPTLPRTLRGVYPPATQEALQPLLARVHMKIAYTPTVNGRGHVEEKV